MPEYRFFFWNEVAEHIAKVDVAECADDAAAGGWVDSAFHDNLSYQVAEIWKGDRLVERRIRPIFSN